MTESARETSSHDYVGWRALRLKAEPARLGRRADTLADERTDLLAPAASASEIAIKYGVGRLVLPEPPARYVPSRIRAIGAPSLPTFGLAWLGSGALRHQRTVLVDPELHVQHSSEWPRQPRIRKCPRGISRRRSARAFSNSCHIQIGSLSSS